MSDILKYDSLIRLAKLAADPISAEDGALYYNTVDNVVKQYLNGSWQGIPTELALSLLDGRVTSVEGDVSTLQGDVSSLDGRVTSAEGNISTLQGDVSSLDGRVTTAEGNISTLQGDVSTLQSDVSSLDGRVTTAEGNISTLQGDVSSLDGRMTTAEGNISTLQSDVSSLDGRVTATEGDISTLQSDVSTLQSDVSTIQSNYIHKDGSVAFTNNQSLGNHKLTSVLDPVDAQDAATKNYVDNAVTGGITGFIKADGSVSFTNNQSLGNHKLTNVLNPTDNQDAATKKYVDDADAGLNTRLTTAEATLLTKYDSSNPAGYITQGDLANIKQTDIYYVDGNLGNDLTGNGSISAPFQTIQAALNYVGQPTSLQDALRHIIINLQGKSASATATFSCIYRENLTVPNRIITIMGSGCKIGNDYMDASGTYGNILKEYSSSRRFGASSSDFRPTLTIMGLTEARDSHSRIRTGMHIGGNVRTAILKRNFDSIQGNGSNKITVHIAAGQFNYPITVTANYPTEPYIRIAVSGTTNYNGTYDITQKIDDTTFVATRVSGTNANTNLETSGSFFESDSAGASGLTHDAAFYNTYVQGQYTCDDGIVNNAAPTAGSEVFYAVNCRFFTGIVGRAIQLQRNDNNTYATATITAGAFNIGSTYVIASLGTTDFTLIGAASNTVGVVFQATGVGSGTGTATLQNYVNTIAEITNSSFSGPFRVNTFTYSTDDMGFINNRFNSAVQFTVNNSGQTVRMDSVTYSSFINTASSWVTNTPTISFLDSFSGVGKTRTAVSADYAVLASDYIIGVTSTAAPRTITLPSSTSLPIGYTLTVKDESGGAATNNIIITRNASPGTDTIQGLASVTLSTNYGVATIYYAGSGKFNIVSSSIGIIKSDGSVAFAANQSMGNNKLINVLDPTSPQDAATKNYVDTLEALDVRLDGSRSMTGTLNMGTHKISNVVDPTLAQDAATKAYVDAGDSALNLRLTTAEGNITTLQGNVSTIQSNYIHKDGSVAFTGNQSMGTHKITDVVDPTLAQDAATKNYVDNAVSGLSGVIKADGSVTFSANQSMGGNQLTHVGTPSANDDAATKLYVDNSVAGLSGVIKADGSITYTADQSMGNHKIINLGAPVSTNDAARKADVDAVQTQVTSLQGDVSTLQSDVTTLQGDVSTLQGNVSTLQSDLSDLDAYAQDIRNDLDVLDGQVIKKDGSVAFTANQSLGSHKLTNVLDPTSAQDAATKAYVDNAVSGTVSGVIKADGSVSFTADQSMGNHKLTNVSNPTLAQDAATKTYVDTADSGLQGQITTNAGNISTLQSNLSTLDGLAIKKDGSVVFTANQSMGSHKLTSLSNGTDPADAVNKSQLDTKYDIPAGTTAQYVRGDGSLAIFPTSIDTATRLTTTVFNKTGSTIPKFSVVYINGGQGDMPTVTLAQGNNEANSTKTYGVTTADILDMQSGTVVATGALTGVNTDQFNPTAPVGDVNGTSLYLSPTTPGGLTTTKPSAPDHMVFVGTIIRTHQTQGVVEIKIQNGFELQELHNVKINGIADAQVLMYDNATLLWKNHSLTKSDVGLSNVDNTSDLNKPISTATQSALNSLDAAMIKKDGSVTFTGDQSMGGHDLTNAGIVQTTQVKVGADQLVISQSGSGAGAYFSFDGKRVNSSAVPTDVHDLTNKTYVDSADTTLQGNITTLDGLVIKKDGSVAFTGNQSLGGHKLTNVLDPSAAQDVATKNYVDTSAIPVAEKGAPNGVATLDGSGKVTASQLPAGALVIKGDWDASTNTPTLVNGVGSVGDTWICNAAGTVNFGAGNISFVIGDWAVYTSSNIWIKVVNSSAVASVNGQTGTVTLNTDNINEGSTNLYFTNTRAVNAVLASDSFIEKDGSVSFTGDQSMGNHKLTNLAAPSSANDAARKTDVDSVQSQVTTLQSDVSTLQTDVGQAQLDIGGLQSDVSTIEGAYIHKDGSVAFTADQSLGNHKLTNVADPVSNQDAATKKYVTDNTVASVNGQSGVVTLNSDNISEGSTNLYFTDERAQDAVGNILVDGATIDFTYLDGTPSISAEVKDASITTVKIAADNVTGAKIRLDNNENLRGRNAANTADVNIVKVNTSDQVEMANQWIPAGSTGTASFGTSNAAWGTLYSGVLISPLSSGVGVRSLDRTNSNTFTAAMRSGDLTTNTAVGGYSTGSVTVRSGNITGTDIGTSGSLTVSTGSITANGGTSGNILISTGSAPSGTRGSVTLNGSTVVLNDAITGVIKAISSGTRAIQNVADPSNPQDAATKAYVDAHSSGSGSAGDIAETSFSGLVNNTSNQTITSFAFSNAVVRSFKASISIVVNATSNQYATYELMGIQRGSDWKMSQNFTGDAIDGLSFDITNAGQVTVSIGNISGFSSALIKFRATTTTV